MITGNKANKQSGGGVYVCKGRHINVQGKTIVENNIGVNGRSGLTLAFSDKNNQAYICNGGLTQGSRIFIGSASTSSNKLPADNALLVKNINEYQKSYYFPEEGQLIYKKEGERSEIYMATAINPFAYSLYLIVALELIGAAAILMKIKRDRSSQDA